MSESVSISPAGILTGRAREKEAGATGMAEGLVVPPGNAGGGKGAPVEGGPKKGHRLHDVLLASPPRPELWRPLPCVNRRSRVQSCASSATKRFRRFFTHSVVIWWAIDYTFGACENSLLLVCGWQLFALVLSPRGLARKHCWSSTKMT